LLIIGLGGFIALELQKKNERRSKGKDGKGKEK
jgi:hypothetical protein